MPRMWQHASYGVCLVAFLALVWWSNPSARSVVHDGSSDLLHSGTISVTAEVNSSGSRWRINNRANGNVRTASPTPSSSSQTLIEIRGGEPQPDADMLALALLVCDVFPEDPYMCQHVVWAESLFGDWRSHVYGPYVSPTCDRGLMQINCIHAYRFAAHGWDYYVDAYDVEKNLIIAREIYNDQGCAGWSTC